MKLSQSITVAVTAAFTLGLMTFLIYSGRDIGSLLNALPAVALMIGTLYSVNRVDKKIDKVDKHTNGTLTAMRAENAMLQAHNSALLTVVTPEQVATVTATIPTNAD